MSNVISDFPGLLLERCTMRRFLSKEAAFYDAAVRRASGWYYLFLVCAIAFTTYRLISGPTTDQFAILAWEVLSLLWFRAASVFHGMAVN
jgi:hypothetical protein